HQAAAGLPEGRDDGLLGEGELRLGGGGVRRRGGQGGRGRVHAHARVAVIELDEDVAGVHDLVVLHQDARDLALDARGQVGDVRLDEGIVGRFGASPQVPRDGARRGGGGGGDGEEHFGARAARFVVEGSCQDRCRTLPATRGLVGCP